MTTRTIPTLDSPPPPAARRVDAVPRGSAATLLGLTALLVAIVTVALLATPAPPVAAAVPGGDIYLSGAVATRFETPGNSGALGGTGFVFVHTGEPWPLRIHADLPMFDGDPAAPERYSAELPLTLTLLGSDGAPLHSFTSSTGFATVAPDEIVLNGTLLDERGETIWLSARFVR